LRVDDVHDAARPPRVEVALVDVACLGILRHGRRGSIDRSVIDTSGQVLDWRVAKTVNSARFARDWRRSAAGVQANLPCLLNRRM
jgi:hypothetical protein